MPELRTVLITGCSSGFGRHTAELLADSGYHVIATMRDVDGKNRAAARELRTFAKEKGRHLEVMELDVSQDSSVAAVAAALAARGTVVDVVVNNAGMMLMGLDETFSVGQVQELFNVNLFGAMRVNRAFLPGMRQRGHGLLVQISSATGRFVFPCLASYCAVKHALEAMAEGMRYELARTGVDSVIVQPGGFATGFTSNLPAPAEETRLVHYGTAAGLVAYQRNLMDMVDQSPASQAYHVVGEAILKVLRTPVGQRPLRTVVDPSMAPLVEMLNSHHDAVATQILTALGLPDLLQPHVKTPQSDDKA